MNNCRFFKNKLFDYSRHIYSYDFVKYIYISYNYMIQPT